MIAVNYLLLTLCFVHAGRDLDADQITVGKIADFNMWSHERTEYQLKYTESCGNYGNVANWSTLKKKGAATESIRTFPGCNGN